MAKQDIVFEYFHGYESEQFAFYRIPKLLFTDDYFRNLSSDAKVLYGLMLDRMSLSVKNHWIDENDRVYIIFTLEQVMKYMNCGKDKGVKILAELDTEKGIGLIERVKRGLGKPAIIYVKSFLIRENNCSVIAESQGAEDRNRQNQAAEVQTSEKPKSGVLENRSLEFGKIEVCTSEKSESGVRKNRSTEFGETAPNYTNNNYTENSDTNLINQSGENGKSLIDEMDSMAVIKAYTKIIKNNIDYESLVQTCKWEDIRYVDEMVELMVEIVGVNREKIMIGGTEYPYQFVKGRLLKINYSHIEYLLECLHKNITKVQNIRAYLLASLFHAPSTINNYYHAEVNHDMYGGGWNANQRIF